VKIVRPEGQGAMIRVNRYNTTGAQPAAQALERKLAELAPLKHFVATGFARNGLFLLARALGWDASAEIIIPAFTCPVIRHTIESAGAMPVPVDAEPDGLNIDADLIEKAITDKTRAVYVVHTYGTAAHMERICAVAKRHNLAVIEDVAHAPFYRYRGRQLGTWGDFAVYSFTKKLVNYEGGAIGTNDTAAFREMMRLRDQYQAARPAFFTGLIDSYVRLVGSWWESGFSTASLCLMKLNDLVNRIAFRGAYGIGIDPGRFMPGDTAGRITVRRLDALKEAAVNDDARFRAFRQGMGGIIGLHGIHQYGEDTLPRYFTGSVRNRGGWLRLLSFRTWRNCNTPGDFPRADYLFASHRVFSKAILLFGRRAMRAPAGRPFSGGARGVRFD